MEQKLSRTHYTKLLELTRTDSLESCCNYINKHSLSPISGLHSFKLFVALVQHIKKESSTRYLLQYLNYLNIEEEVKSSDPENYLLCIGNVAQFVISKNAWDDFLEMQNLFQPFDKHLKDDDKNLFLKISLIFVRGLYKSTSDIKPKTVTSILKYIINVEEFYSKDMLLSQLMKMTQALSGKSYAQEMGMLCLDSIIQNSLDVFVLKNFQMLFVILTRAFPADIVTKSPRKLTETINVLIGYSRQFKSRSVMKEIKFFEDILNYFLSTLEFYTTLDKIDFNNPGLFMVPMNKLSIVYDFNQQLITNYLLQVVLFSNNIQKYLKSKDNQLKAHLPKISFTPDLVESLLSYMSHAKSQAIILKRSSMLTPCCCSIRTNISLAIEAQMDAFKYVTMILELAKEPSEIPFNVYMAVQQLFTKALKYLELLKAAGCESTNRNWECVCHTVYSMCTKMAAKKRLDVNYLFIELLIRTSFIYSDKFHVINEKYTIFSFYMLAECLTAKKKWSATMDVVALCVLLYKSEASVLARMWNVWNLAVYNSKVNETICDVLEKSSDYLKTLYYVKHIEREEKIQLYKAEIENYQCSYASGKQIEKCVSSLVHLMDANEFLKYLQTQSLELLQKLNYNVFLSTHSALGETKKSKGSLENAFYNYCLYKGRIREAREQFKCLPKITKIEREHQAVQDDENDQDYLPIATNYSHINIRVYEKLITPLHDSLSSLIANCSIKHFQPTELILHIMIDIGYELELHCSKGNAYDAWENAYKVANTLKLSAKAIEAATFLIRHEADTDSKLIPECFRLIKDDSANLIPVNIKLPFYAQSAIFYLNSDKLREFRECYHIAQEMFYAFGGSFHIDPNTEPDFEKSLASAHFALLIGAMEMLPCREVIDEMHGVNTFLVPSHAWTLLLTYIKAIEPGKFTRLMLGLFVLGEHIVWKHYWSGLHREALQYAGSLLKFAEGAIIPLRALRQLLSLGKSWNLYRMVDRIHECLADIDAILGIEYSTERVEQLTNQLGNLMLLRDSSPVAMQTIRMPAFLSTMHDNCQCTLCTSSEYQTIFLERIHIETALLGVYDENFARISAKRQLNKVFELYHRLQTSKGFHCNEVYGELLWTKMQILWKTEDFSTVQECIKIYIALHKKGNIKNLYLSHKVKHMLGALNMRNKMAETKEQKICERTKPPVVRDQGEPSPLLEYKKLPRNPARSRRERGKKKLLEVSEPMSQPRTRLRGKNLRDELDGSK